MIKYYVHLRHSRESKIQTCHRPALVLRLYEDKIRLAMTTFLLQIMTNSDNERKNFLSDKSILKDQQWQNVVVLEVALAHVVVVNELMS